MRRSVLFNLILSLLTVAAIAGGYMSFQRKHSSFGRLDFRYHWVSGAMAIETVDPGSGAERSGLRAGDSILAIGSVPAGEIEGVKRALRKSGETPIVVQRGARTMMMRYRAPDTQVDYQYLFLSSIGFLYLGIGLYTFLRGARDESTIFFLLTILAFIVYVYSPAGAADGTYRTLYLIEDFARIFLPPLSLQFFLGFPRPVIKRRSRIALLYLPPALIALWVIDLFGFGNAISIFDPATSLRIIDRWEMLHFAIYFTLSFIALTYSFRTTPAAGEKNQVKWIYLGVSLGFLPFTILYLIPYVLKGSASPYTTAAIIPLALVPLAFAVSILKYKLWDVEVVIKEVLAYTVTLMFGIIAFSTVNIVLTRLVAERLALERNFLAFTSGLAIAAVLIPVKSRIETLLEMVLYRETYRHRKAMSDFASELATFHDLNELIDMIRQRLTAAVRIQKINLYVRDGLSLLLYAGEAALPERVREEDFPPAIARGPVALGEPRLIDHSEIPGKLFRSGYRYVFPLRHRNRVEGMLICSAKKGDEPLSRDDFNLVGSITAPLALAIENGRLYNRLRRQLVEIGSLKEYNENIIESSSSAIAVVSRDGIILTANHAFWELVATDPDNDSTIEQLFPPYTDIRGSNAAAQYSFVNQAGQEKQVSVTASRFTASDAPEGTLVLVLTDNSARVHLERELQEKERLASLGLLAAGVAHEVNTPIAGISSYAQLLLKDLSPDDPSYAILKKMEQQTFRASRIVDNLLNFAQARPRPTELVSLAELIRLTIDLHQEIFAAKEIMLYVGELPELHCRGNFYELQQVLTNLLLNARDAVERGGSIWLDLKTERTSAVITVLDNGKGLPADLGKEIMKPLVTTKKNQGGTGLGLAISDRIVQASGGSIVFGNAPDGGATFSVVLPLHEPDVTH
ncbi:MAG TPA: ATP-binding protein [Thermoanaerobaculia bacterium]|nr:ATP-binding protein [Thermoanaerobaculia bacterium]